MTALATAFVELRPDMDGFGRDVTSGADSAGSSAGKRFTSRFGAALKVGGALAAAFAVTKGVQFLGDAVEEASNLGESLNAVQVTFGKNADEIGRLGREAAQSVGLSQVEFNGLAVQFGSFAETIAGKGGDVVGTLDDLTGRGADFASVMNLEVNDAMEMFQSGLAGETEPLRKFGIDLSAAAVNAYAYKNGIAEAGEELSANEQVQARYGLLMEETAKTQGDFANTSDSLANTQRRLGAEFDNIKASLGEALLPIIEKLANFVADRVVPVVTKFIDQMKSGKGAGGDFADILGNVWEAFQTAFTYVRENVMPVLERFWGFIKNKVVPAVQEALGDALEGARDAIDKLATKFEENRPTIRRFAEGVRQIATWVVENVIPALGKFARHALPMLADAIGFAIDHARRLGIAWLRMTEFGARAFRMLLDAARISFDKILSAAEAGIGWIPGWGRKIHNARVVFDALGDGASADLRRIETAAGNAADSLDRVARDRRATVTVSTFFETHGTPPSGAALPPRARRATGGPVVAGRSYIVGEREPEVFTPNQSGRITPGHQVGAAATAELSDRSIDRLVVAQYRAIRDAVAERNTSAYAARRA